MMTSNMRSAPDLKIAEATGYKVARG